VKIVLFEDLAAESQKVVRQLWSFLGVDPGAELSDLRPRNVAPNPWLRPLYRIAPIRRLTRDLVPPEWLERARTLLNRPGSRAPMHPDARRLLVDYFRPHNRELESLLERDLSHWDR